MPPPSKGPRYAPAQRLIALVVVALHLVVFGLWLTDVISDAARFVSLVAIWFAAFIFSVLATEKRALERSAESAEPDAVDSSRESAPPAPSSGDGPFREAELRGAELADRAAAEHRSRIRRRWIGAGVALALLVQALIPLRYYLGDDEYDERFSWRMFSAVRMQECDIRASETKNGRSEPVRLMATVQAGWVNTLRRNREAVWERYLEWRCEQPDVERARLENRCTTPEGERLPVIVSEIDCASGAITASGGRR